MPAATAAKAPVDYQTPSAVGKSAKSDPGKKGNDWWGMVKQTFADFGEDKAMKQAAALALYIILALAPLLVISLKVVSIVAPKSAPDQVRAQATQLVGGTGGAAIGEMITKSQEKQETGTLAAIISFAIVLFSASGVFAELQDSMNTIWEVRPKPGAPWYVMIFKRLFSMGMVLAIVFLLMVSMFVTATVMALGKKMFGDLGWLVQGLELVLSTAVAWVLFAAIFKFIPDAKVEWRDVWVGGLVTAILFTLGRIGLGLYFKFSAPDSTYGAFGSVVAVLLWAYYSSILLFLGAEFTQVWARSHGREIQPDKQSVKVTDGERAQQGLVSDERLQKAAREDRGHRPPQGRQQPKYVRPPANLMTPGVSPGDGQGGLSPVQLAMAAGGLVVGAVAGVLGAEYLLHDPKKPTARHAAAVRLNDRLDRVEQKIGRVSRLKHYLEEMDVKERIDRVEKEIVRAGRHVRAEETGRPLWLVRLGDLIGGRWSNLQPARKRG
jgi:membrane protein